MLRSHRRLTDSLRCDCAAAVTGMAEIVSSSRDLGVGCLGDFYLYLEDSPLRLSVVVIWVLTAWGHLRGDHSPFCVFDRRAMSNSPCVRVARRHEAKRPRHSAFAQDCLVFETADGHRIFHAEAEIDSSNLPGTSNQPIPALQEPPGTAMFAHSLLQQKQYGFSDAYVDTGSTSIMSFPSALAASNRQRRRSRVRHMVADEPLSITLPLDKSYVDALKDAYPERSYYGGPEHICPYCHAVFWFQERVKNDSCLTQRKIVYNLCCKGGKVNLKPFERPPPLLVDLLRFDGGTRSRHFLRLIRSYNSLFVFTSLDGLCLSGGSPCKWYINPDVPEACALMASARKAHSPIKWNEVVSSNQPMPHVPEEQKIACIRDLHPFENKDREFLVTVTIKKIGYRWWYNACKKCTRTTVAHGDSYKCSDQVCATIGTPNQRTRSSPAKTVTKRLFTDIDGGTTGFKDAADNAAAPSPSKDA
ncbi:Helicase [Zea mays]|uniref:Helicase n=1 Tax=Zea mays TaxID=4577 RepID=A0A1D6E3M4_MAIZE|nr:Helicase [Zea mays]